MKIPAPMMPPITAMVVPKRPRCRARPLPGEDGTLEFSDAVAVTRLRSTRLRQIVEVLDVGERCAVHALHFRVAGFDDVILVGRMRAAAMTQAEVARGQA